MVKLCLISLIVYNIKTIEITIYKLNKFMKRNTIIKILSLALGLTIGIVLIGKIFFSLSINTGIKDYDRIYLIQTNIEKGEEPLQSSHISGGVTTGFKNEIPGIESATKTTSFFPSSGYKDSKGNVWEYKYPEAIAADSCFFEVFEVKTYGKDPKEILQQIDKILISKSFAEKLGGVQEAIGQIIINEDYPDFPMTVEGVFENLPSNSTISPEIIFSIALLPEMSTENWFGNDRYTGYVKLHQNINPGSLKESIEKMMANHDQLKEYEKLGMNIWFSLGNIHTIYVNSKDVKNTILILSIVAFLIVTISLLNYILVVVSDMVRKSKEIGIRKCYGGDKASIYFMLLRESTWQIIISLLLVATLIFFGRGFIKEYTGFYFSELLVWQSILAIGIVIVLIFILSVFVPAKIYLKLPVERALRGFSSNSRKWKMSLLGLQVTINVFIVCFVIIASVQYIKITKFYPGYQTENLCVIDFFSKNLNDYARIKESLKSIPEVEGVGATFSLPIQTQSGNNVTFPNGNENNNIHVSDLYWSEPEVFDMFEIKFIEGHKPLKEQEIAVSKSFVDQMRKLGELKDSPLGHQVNVTDRDVPLLTISGVYDDIMLGNLLYADMRPSIWEFGSLNSINNYFDGLVVKTTQTNRETLTKIKEIAETQLDGKKVDIFIVKELVKDSYNESLKIRNIFMIGGTFSILIALMGLIGFLNDESQRRRKELAIRKINGASSKDLFSLFYSSIIKLSLASAIVACCGAFIMGRHWLQQFSEKISLSPLIFICGTLFILIIVTIVVMINSYKVVSANPTQSLYNE